MTGSIVTFYSYKGGVGRSFALANIATLLGRWGLRVLCIDWDLEAPGLSHYFDSPDQEAGVKPLFDDGVPGLVESLSDFRSDPTTDLVWNDRIILLPSTATPRVSLLKVGRVDATYSQRLHDLDWHQLYRSGLGEALQDLFATLRQEYDFILIDARTGVTDFSGITNAQLPDILVFLFTSNEQSFEGAKDVARRAVAERNRLQLDLSRLFLLPIPARFEVQFEHKLSTSWQRRFGHELREFYESWTDPRTNYQQLSQLTTIPYVPIWSFGERLAVLEDTSRDPLSIVYSLETIAALLAHRLDHTRLLLDSRDDFVASARRITQREDQTSYSVFLSYCQEDAETALALAKKLEEKGLHIFRPHVTLGGTVGDEIEDFMNRAAHMIVLLGPAGKQSSFQEFEVRAFLRQSVSDDQVRLLIPIALHDVDMRSIPTVLRQYKVIPFSGDYDRAVTEVIGLIRSTVTAKGSSGTVFSVKATTDGDIAIEGVHLCALADNNTTITGVTDHDGRASVRLLVGRRYRLLIAHPKYASKVLDEVHVNDNIDIRLPMSRHIGSVILHSTGYIPGLNGRLNPILDTLNRKYMYADNVAVNGGQQQPVSFEVDKPFELEDAQGSKFEVSVKLISGRTSLLEYRRIP